ncbi:MAG TPA: hypothetical protein VGR93_01635 [Candidatus Acidoferrales bacterium]|nr:hypothetical protein [Candidatus Acidoferrales bacterium]
MSADFDDLDAFAPRPFWFVSAELLAEMWHAEINAIIQLFANHPELRKLFDAPEATIQQRSACFELLAHRKIVETVAETFLGRYEDSPGLSEKESSAVGDSQSLVSPDAPAWLLEMNEVAELLPVHIHHALPEPLREEGWYRNDSARDEAVRLAARTLSTVEQIQILTARVIDEQLQRLRRRWSATVGAVETHLRKKKKIRRTSDALRLRRDQLIAEIDDVSATVTEFIQLMDERKVRPQPTWSGWPGSWKEAYKIPRLRRLIHQDKSRALSRRRRK